MDMRKISCYFSHEHNHVRIYSQDMSLPDERGGSWTLLTGHGHVLVEIARNPQARMRDIADAADITERTAQAIVADLEAAGYITRTRVGRRTRYTVNRDSLFRHPAQEGLRIGPFLALLAPAGSDTAHPGPKTGETGRRRRRRRMEAHAAPAAAPDRPSRRDGQQAR
jgi:hypothetical protein